MHSKHILHRDIKPENILVFNDDPIHIKITDFGWGAFAGDGERMTRCGTLDQMCPETVSAKKRPHSFALDYWTLGVLCYELASGRPPFSWSKEKDKIKDNIQKIEYLCPSWFSLELRNFIDKFIQWDPEERMDLREAYKHPFIVMHKIK